MRRAVPVIFALLVGLLGCKEKCPTVTSLPLQCAIPAQAVSVQASVEGEGPAVQGQTVSIRFAVTNISEGPVVLERAQAWVGRASAHYQWRERVYGSVYYDEETDAYYLNEMAQMEALAANWSTGLLLPGETAHCAMGLQLLQSGELQSGCELVYYAQTFEEMAPQIYLERERDAFEVTYGPASVEELKAFAATDEVRLGPRVVIQRPDGDALVASAGIVVRVASAPFTPEQAMGKAGLQTDRYAYSEKRKAWLLEAPEAVVLVTPRGVRTYAGCTLAVWQFVEASEDRVYFWYLADDEALHALFGAYDFLAEWGYHAYVPRRAALPLIARAHRAGYLSHMSEFQFIPCVSFEPLKPSPSG